MVVVKRYAALFVVLLSVPFLNIPAADASETLSGDYEVGVGVRHQGNWQTFYACGLSHGICDLDDDGVDDVGIGGQAFHFRSNFRNVYVWIDDVIAQDIGFIVNTWGSPDSHEWFCGSTGYQVNKAPFREASVFVANLVVDDNLGVCGATRGTITAKGY